MLEVFENWTRYGTKSKSVVELDCLRKRVIRQRQRKIYHFFVDSPKNFTFDLTLVNTEMVYIIVRTGALLRTKYNAE